MPDFTSLIDEIDVLKNRINALSTSTLNTEEILYLAESLNVIASALGVSDIAAATADAITQVQAAGTATIAVVNGTANGAAVANLQDDYLTLQDSYNNLNPRVTTIETAINNQTSAIASASAQAAAATYNAWVTVTASRNAVNKDRLMVIPQAAPNAITITLPAGPSVGDVIEIIDIAGTAGTTNFTVARNGEKIQGLAENLIFNVNGKRTVLLYSGTTYGWRIY
jgi:uncharacterized protein (DUF4213/DUF364 family)